MYSATPEVQAPCARTAAQKERLNVDVLQTSYNLYYFVSKRGPVPKNEELFVDYGASYWQHPRYANLPADRSFSSRLGISSSSSEKKVEEARYYRRVAEVNGPAENYYDPPPTSRLQLVD